MVRPERVPGKPRTGKSQRILFDSPATQSVVLGESLRDESLAKLERKYSSFDRLARRKLVEIFLERGSGTTDDVREILAIPGDINPKVFGAVPRMPEILVRLGYENSRRPEAHGRVLAVWTMIDRERARRWLDEHPASTDLEEA